MQGIALRSECITEADPIRVSVVVPFCVPCPLEFPSGSSRHQKDCAASDTEKEVGTQELGPKQQTEE